LAFTTPNLVSEDFLTSQTGSSKILVSLSSSSNKTWQDSLDFFDFLIFVGLGLVCEVSGGVSSGINSVFGWKFGFVYVTLGFEIEAVTR